MDDTFANESLLNAKILKPSKYITALKMRTNVRADKASLMRAKMKGEHCCT
jgi:hypothetical protein